MDIRDHLKKLLDGQPEHPVYPPIEVDWDAPIDMTQCTVKVGDLVEVVGWDRLLRMVSTRRKVIEQEQEDPLRSGYEPPFWREVDLRVARMRLANPGVQLEVLLMGGIRSGKTEFATKRLVQHFFWTPQAWCWGLHEIETSSKRIQQRRVHRFLPCELDTSTGKHKKDKNTHFSYSEGNGFTGNQFTLSWQAKDWRGAECSAGGMMDFKFYKSQDSTLQGAELTCATSDELIPKATCDTVRERLLSRAEDTKRESFLSGIREAIRILEDGGTLPPALIALVYYGCHLISFTPKEGYSATVADFLDGAVTIEDVEAELLPLKNGAPQRVPRFKQPRRRTRLVAYFHTKDNVFRGNYPAMAQQCAGAKEDYVRVIAYGDVAKGWASTFPKWRDTVHVLPREAVPREGTWYEICDPAGARNWFLLWAVVDPAGRKFIVREWPQEGDYIPDQGDPGPWAVTSETGARNGDAGDAQESFGWGFERYAAEIRRVREEIGAWWSSSADGCSGAPIAPAESYMDSRLGQAQTTAHGAATTIMDELNQLPGMAWIPASGDRLAEGDALINDHLDYDEGKAVSPLNAPRLQVTDNCRAVIFMFQTYGPATRSRDEACKDPRDCVAYLVNANPEYLGGDALDPVGGGSY